ncbi:MAG: thiosulfate oxidation carrier protein SoxY [Halarcobacter sp.]
MMERRNFLSLGLGVLAASVVVPSTLSAVDYRKDKPKAWEQDKIDLALKEIFGTSETAEGKVKLKAPDIAENGAVIPVTVSAKAGTRVAILQDVNPQSLVAVFTVPKGGIVDYSVRIKMMKTGNVYAIVEDGGKLYKASKQVKVTIGGCGG